MNHFYGKYSVIKTKYEHKNEEYEIFLLQEIYFRKQFICDQNDKLKCPNTD